ncbi:phosphoribosyltransferase [Spiribacter insolitus]|uniref:Phosphoribosyltransferase family protein n=1 Tax=Spiribacter insolitus TaxID=3122417 RepID=A0ABV3T7C8_9GAMM
MAAVHYRNRIEAANRLADILSDQSWTDPVVLGIPRGGVPMADIVARRLGAALDVVLVHKIRAPGNPEYAIGSVDETGQVTLSDGVDASVDDDAVHQEIEEEKAVLIARRRRYGKPRQRLSSRDVIVVDDGAATGATVVAAVNAVRRDQAASVTIALGVAAPEVIRQLKEVADGVICPSQPAGFMAVSQAFGEFPQVSDEEVERILPD